MDEDLSFEQWLRRRRRALDLTQGELARRVGCAEGTIRKFEAGILRPSKQMAERLAAACGVPAAARAEFVSFARGLGGAAGGDMLPLAAGPAPLVVSSPTAPAAGSLRGRQPPAGRPLPVATTPLFGREDDVRAVCALLRQREVRLVSLLGPPGVGKTRLGLQVATEMGGEPADGVLLVPLAAIDEPDLVPAAILAALDVRPPDGQGLHVFLRSYLRDRELLLLLDNVEQVAGCWPLIVDLLAAAPGLKLLLTSRVALRISAEQEYRVAPLEVPDPDRLPPTAELSRCASVALFCARARAARADFALTPENAPAVVAICALLDGLPLAIELAAARVRLFSPRELLARMDRRLDLLTQGARDHLPRQQTLREAIGWSYDLLAPGEQSLLRCLGLFAGGCTLHAVEAVCNRDGTTGAHLLDTIAALLDQSLVQHVELDGELRINMLATLRDYALERLMASGEEAQLRRRHALYYLALAEEAETGLVGPEQPIWLRRLAIEQDNLRAALAWSRQTPGEAEVARRIAGALWWAWWALGRSAEGRKWITAALEGPQERTMAAAKAHYAAGALAYFTGDYQGAGEHLNAARAIYDELGASSGRAHTLIVMSGLTALRGDHAAGRALVEESAGLFRAGGPADLWGLGLALINMRLFTIAAGDYAGAQAHGEEALAVFRTLGQPYGISIALNGLGDVARVRGDYAAAAALYEESLAMAQLSGVRSDLAAVLHNLGYARLAEGNTRVAAGLFVEGVALQQEMANAAGVAECLTGLAGVAATSGKAEFAARLFGMVDRAYGRSGGPAWPPERAEYERYLAATRAQLDAAAFEAAWRDGYSASLDRVVAEVLEWSY